jgi:hypothetical protein
MHHNIFALFIIIAQKTLVDLQFAPGGVLKSTKAPAHQSDAMINSAIRHYDKLFLSAHHSTFVGIRFYFVRKTPF